MIAVKLKEFQKVNPNPDQLSRFEKIMDGEQITEELCVKSAELFSWNLFAEAFLSADGLDRYRYQSGLIWDKWSRDFNSGWDAGPDDRRKYKEDLARLFVEVLEGEGVKK